MQVYFILSVVRKYGEYAYKHVIVSRMFGASSLSVRSPWSASIQGTSNNSRGEVRKNHRSSVRKKREQDQWQHRHS